MKNKYTFITLLAAFAFIIGSMAGMNFILKIREEHLLKESGEVMMESPVLAWQGYGNSAENQKEEDADGAVQVLTMEQIEDAVRSWNERKGELLHNPVEGQISMEEAIAAGEEWLAKMGFTKDGKEDAEVYHVKATLGMGVTETNTKTQKEPYYSFWTIGFANESKYITLYLNAVTGGVWGADISLYGDFPKKLPYENLELFVELAGLQIEEESALVNNPQSNQAMFAIKGSSSLYAQERKYTMAVQEEEYYDIEEKVVIASIHNRISYQLLFE